MRSKSGWFASAGLLWLVFCLIGYVGMVLKRIERIFDPVPADAVMMQGAEWMMLTSLVFAFSVIACGILAERLRVRRALVHLGLQAGAVLFGANFIWTLAYDAVFLIFWALFYAALFMKPFVLERHEDVPAWNRWGLFGLTAASAAFLYVLGQL